MRKFKSNIKKIIESLGYLTTIFSNEVDPKFEIKSERENSFCGYYDFNPICKEKLIFNSISKSQSEGDLNLKCKIKLFNLKTRKSSLVFNSKTWNWQLGSRVMWLGNNKIILNDACKNDFERTNILNEDGNLIQTLPFNFWNKLTLKDNHLIGRINMHTLSFLRPGYGYKSKCYKGNYQFLEIYTLDKETFAEQKIFELDSKQLEEISLNFAFNSNKNSCFSPSSVRGPSSPSSSLITLTLSGGMISRANAKNLLIPLETPRKVIEIPSSVKVYGGRTAISGKATPATANGCVLNTTTGFSPSSP